MTSYQTLETVNLANPANVLGQIKNLECRLATNPLEILNSQKMRYDIFYEEMSAEPDLITRQTRQDADRFDEFCDHLLVLDNELDGSGRSGNIVGSYRLLMQEKIRKKTGFYSQSEFDVDALTARHPDKQFLEFGRSCVLPSYRNKRTIELLWQGSWAYIRRHNIDVMFGCASFEGTDIEELAESLSFLYHNSRAKREWKVKAQPGRGVKMKLIDKHNLDNKAVIRKLPPMIKGYLRLGALFGGEAVIDYEFGCTDVMVIMPVSNLNPRYVNYYGENAERHQPSRK